VGPELTEEGKSYPWFIKESIIWPQADLPTSTMPNYHLDHEELQDLMTFLLGQKGGSQAISVIERKKQLQEWEAGKAPFERAISPRQIVDLRYGMQVFAEQGCAACHRLQGFTSDVGFAAEKLGAEGADQLRQQRAWFRQLFPETIVGSDIVKVIQANQEKIDQVAAVEVRKNSILEEVDQLLPGGVASFYSEFKYAARSRNQEFADRIALASTAEEAKQLHVEHQQWLDRVHRVLMLFVQEYGLGRLVGPRPNWSGIYRSDQWLMEHFRNPQGHIPRSIMPVFPFDDSKFQALTHMLDELGLENRQRVRSLWQTGFDPAEAYEIHCAQCHGDQRLGNGPVASWIYPIPKNLRNAGFMRHLTKERAIFSITHGVAGTPMAPWGEVAKGKEGPPILTSKEISLLVDWLYQDLPGEQLFKAIQATPKWEYTPEDVLRELHEEGHSLPSNKAPLSGLMAPLFLLLLFGGKLFGEGGAAQTTELFELVPNPPGAPDKYNHYIRQSYYTPENIAEGRAFFEMNCAACHGKEADGAGARAEAMVESKPRMLTNLDWSDSHDDLRLLRSIKYGVPGTSMTPWGDQTSALQRIQLVVYLRSLLVGQKLQKQLDNALYAIMEQPKQLILEAREPIDKQLEEKRGEWQKLPEESAEMSEEKVVELFRARRGLQQQIDVLQEEDQKLQDLLNPLLAQVEAYRAFGQRLIATPWGSDLMPAYLAYLELQVGGWSLKGQQLEHEAGIGGQRQVDTLKRIGALIDRLQEQVRDAKKIEMGRLSSAERTMVLKILDLQGQELEKLQKQLESFL